VLAHENPAAFDRELEWLDSLLFESVRLLPRSQRGYASDRRLAASANELDVGMGGPHRRVEVAPIERLIATPQRGDDFRIPVVHGPRSISLTPPRFRRDHLHHLTGSVGPIFRHAVTKTAPERANLANLSGAWCTVPATSRR